MTWVGQGCRAGQGETFDIGFDTGVPVTGDYPVGAQFPGTVSKVTIEYTDT